ncbi:aldehyde dehydrogenase, partial [Tsukamurella sp. 8J]|nr:aldehyde dehydrogenase [Tsukamurella sp. 8J]
LAEHLAARAGDAVAVAGADRLVAELGGGLAALRPAVHALPVADDRVDAELPFPCVWVAALPDAPALEAVAPLRGSLVVSVLGRADLVPALLDDPTIGCVYVGRPTHFAAPEVPHDGFLADFLMRTKGFAAG